MSAVTELDGGRIPTRDCGICLEELKNGKSVVAHARNGQKHPIHKICLTAWLKTSNQCPDCRVRIKMTAPRQENSYNPLAGGIGAALMSGVTIAGVKTIVKIVAASQAGASWAQNLISMTKAVAVITTIAAELFSKTPDPSFNTIDEMAYIGLIVLAGLSIVMTSAVISEALVRKIGSQRNATIAGTALSVAGSLPTLLITQDARISILTGAILGGAISHVSTPWFDEP